MTLVLTELQPGAIAMAADTAVTMINNATNTVSVKPNAATKLQVIDYLQAGISCWGLGNIGKQNTDEWLTTFIQANNKIRSLEEFASCLADELNRQVGASPTGENRLGFHVAGFEEFKGEKVPSFYHVHDGPSTTLEERGVSIDPNKFNANHDMPPDIIRQKFLIGEAWRTRNGDYKLYASIFGQLETFFAGLKKIGIEIPHAQSVEDLTKYLVFQIRTIASLYNLSNLIPGIGGGISYLSINPDGIQSYGISYS